MAEDALFDHYEQELRTLVASAGRKVAQALNVVKDQTKCRASLEAAGDDVTDAEGVLRSMDLEAKSAKDDTRARLEARLATSKMELGRVKDEMKRVRKMQMSADRVDLFGDEDIEAGSLGERARMVDSTERKLNHGSDRIRESVRIANETESIGASILETLSGQRQTMLRARDNLGVMDEDLTRSRGLLSTMARRVLMHKLVIYTTVAALSLALFLIIIFRLFPRRS
mmetsp:Transcript_5512/g.16449  ORF Transcript_5512/g.16449 Transcript_5512/m.16449 type:complete len:227 (-) Transcript_5512:127-807(-)